MRSKVNELGWQLEYPEVQQQAPAIGDQQSQVQLGTQDSTNFSESSLTESQQGSMFLRYLATKPFVRYQADRSRLVSARRHVIGF